jgi:hypothetical protein
VIERTRGPYFTLWLINYYLVLPDKTGACQQKHLIFKSGQTVPLFPGQKSRNDRFVYDHIRNLEQSANGYIQPLEKCPRHDRFCLISEELDDEN